MESFFHQISRNGLRWLIVIKVLVVSYVISDHFGLITIGEKKLQALSAEPKKDEKKADDKDAKKDEKKEGEEVAEKPVIVKPSAEEIKARLTKELYPEEEDTSKDTVLERLLTLPSLNKESVKKDEIGRYLALVDRKQKLLDDRITVIKDQEKLLKDMELSIDQKIKKLGEEMAFFKETQQKEKELEKERLDKLIDFYQKMAPKKSAPIFEKLDKDLVVSMWKRFPEKTTMQILALMNPDKSVELSEYFGRIKSTKEYDILKEINVDLQKEFAQCKTPAEDVEALR